MKYQWINRHRKAILFSIIILFLTIVAPSINKPFILDEVAVVEAAKGILSLGLPARYYGEQVKTCLALEHPPLFFYLLALIFRIFGVSEFSGRLLPILFSLLSLILIYLTAQLLFKERKEAYGIALLSALLYAINPFVIQNSLLLDIDGSILTFSIMLFTYFFVKYEQRNEQRINILRTLILGTLLSFVWWSKFQGGFIIIGSLILFSIASRNIKRNLYNTLSITVVGTCLFLVSWWAYTAIFYLPFSTPLKHNIALAQSVYALSTLLLVGWSVKNLLFWVTPPFFIILGVFFIKRIGAYWKDRKMTAFDFPLIVGLLILVLFTFIRQTAFGYPKYFAPMMPAFSIAVGYTIHDFLSKIATRKTMLMKATFLVIGVMVFNFVLLKDPFIRHNIFYTESITLTNNLPVYIQSQLEGLIVFIPLIIAFLGFMLMRYRAYTSFMLSSILVLFLLSLHIDYTQANAGYSTSYAYGQSGMIETGKYLHAHTNPDDTIIAPLTIGYYSGRKYFRSYPIHGEFALQKVVSENDIPYIVVGPSDKFAIPQDYKIAARFGHFKVYRKDGET